MKCMILLFLLMSVAISQISSAQTRRPRIAVAGISHESNSFFPSKTGLADFDRRAAASREETLREWSKSKSTVSGYVEGAQRFGLELYPTLVTGASPKGPVTDEAFNTLMDEMIRQLKAAPKLDGLLLANHGAMVVESFPNGDAEVVLRLRAALGPDFPIVVTHDFHANVSEEIIKHSTALITYKENPHIDTFERGIQAAQSVVVVTDNDPALAKREAERLAGMLWATRDKIKLNLPDAAAAVKQAASSDKFPVVLPVVLIDMGDNIGGGSAGDSTFVLDELLKQKTQGWVMTICDRGAVEAAARIGVNGNFEVRVGGKTDRLHGEPVLVQGRVKSLHDGKYIEPEIRHGGERYFDQGLSAVIEVEGSTRDLPNLLLLTSERSSPNSLHQLISCGIYPERQKILVSKGAIAPRAAYEPIAGRFIEVDTPGATAVNPARFTYKRARRPLFGLDQNQQ